MARESLELPITVSDPVTDHVGEPDRPPPEGGGKNDHTHPGLPHRCPLAIIQFGLVGRQNV
jgi:hypothetical protein